MWCENDVKTVPIQLTVKIKTNSENGLKIPYAIFEGGMESFACSAEKS